MVPPSEQPPESKPRASAALSDLFAARTGVPKAEKAPEKASPALQNLFAARTGTAVDQAPTTPKNDDLDDVRDALGKMSPETMNTLLAKALGDLDDDDEPQPAEEKKEDDDDDVADLDDHAVTPGKPTTNDLEWEPEQESDDEDDVWDDVDTSS